MLRLHLPRRNKGRNVCEPYVTPLYNEAVASVALDNDPDYGTHVVPDSTIEEVLGSGIINDDIQTEENETMSEFYTDQPEETPVSNAASASEARAWLLDNPNALPEGVNVGARGRLSAQAREAFTNATGREVK